MVPLLSSNWCWVAELRGTSGIRRGTMFKRRCSKCLPSSEQFAVLKRAETCHMADKVKSKAEYSTMLGRDIKLDEEQHDSTGCKEVFLAVQLRSNLSLSSDFSFFESKSHLQYLFSKHGISTFIFEPLCSPLLALRELLENWIFMYMWLWVVYGRAGTGSMLHHAILPSKTVILLGWIAFIFPMEEKRSVAEMQIDFSQIETSSHLSDLLSKIGFNDILGVKAYHCNDLLFLFIHIYIEEMTKWGNGLNLRDTSLL